MSEPNETFPFREEDGSGIDFDAIFGSGGAATTAPSPTAPQDTAVSETQAPEKPASAPAEEQDLFTVFSDASADPPGAAQAEERPAAPTQVSLFDKPPVFSYLIQSGSTSPTVMERWINKISALEGKKRHYEDILRRELDGLDDEFETLKFLSQELSIRVRGLRGKRVA